MNKSVVCLSHNRKLFLADFIHSFIENSEPDTNLYLGLQGCTDGSNLWMKTEGNRLLADRTGGLFFFEENIGLNRYDEIVSQMPDGIIIDTDDDSLLVKGYEKAFEVVLSDERVGWVGILEKGTRPIQHPSRETVFIKGYRLVRAAVGGGLAATRKEMWTKLGGFGQGKTIFDPEDARYQRKCNAAGLISGMITDLEYVHRGDWETLEKYGYAKQKLDNLFNAMNAGFVSEEDYRISVAEYLGTVERMK